jgi:hypothetical protein
MAYAQGGIIAAADYNNIVGSSPSSTANQINTVWAVGNGQYGYGQTALTQVAASGTVTATQWATAINTLNSIRTHQSGSGTGITAPTAGNLIAYLANFQTNVNTAYTNKSAFASQGATTTGTVYTASATAATGVTYGETTVFQRVVTFSSGDAARYFFNAGGQINFVITGVTNNDGTSRSADAVTTIATNLGGVSAFRATTMGGRTGTGGTLNSNLTAFGYYNLIASPQTTQYVTSTSATYTSDFAKVYFGSNGTNVSGHGDTGSIINIYLNYASVHSGAFNNTLNITVSHRIDIVYPESTNLSNSWGTVTVS